MSVRLMRHAMCTMDAQEGTRDASTTSALRPARAVYSALVASRRARNLEHEPGMSVPLVDHRGNGAVCVQQDAAVADVKSRHPS